MRYFILMALAINFVLPAALAQNNADATPTAAVVENAEAPDLFQQAQAIIASNGDKNVAAQKIADLMIGQSFMVNVDVFTQNTNGAKERVKRLNREAPKGPGFGKGSQLNEEESTITTWTVYHNKWLLTQVNRQGEFSVFIPEPRGAYGAGWIIIWGHPGSTYIYSGPRG